ncbi:probable LRR receptor-like serine/threonine-protein kinase At1g12460 isoform X4 [Camellia sinensis]|uniref:probable LRR receptor-like serine/threonine-protein kinase At1g12460 isoform X4 n=1 Tax=Camellia sinensis TaxID=4442 RepID=UPI001036110A|nr:probable LRR receptor-like serine/threonine-protein kinase At1g12460 isoform X4 [Camellia sinensis]
MPLDDNVMEKMIDLPELLHLVGSLNGSIPIEVVGLKRLLVFRLGNNSVDGTVPAGFGSIELLEVLDLHNLKLVGNIPEEISNCKFLLQFVQTIISHFI